MLALTLVGGFLFVTSCVEDDLLAPVITLEGANPDSVALGDAYTEPGATAEDVEDGTISTIEVDVSALDENTVGSYDITYSATDEAGNVGTATRTINVYAEASDYAGTYDVHEDCGPDGEFDYSATVAASATSGQVIITNLGDFSPAAVVEMTFSGPTGSDLAIDDSDGGLDFTGDGALDMGTTTAMEFTVTYTTIEPGVDTFNCVATFTKQ